MRFMNRETSFSSSDTLVVVDRSKRRRNIIIAAVVGGCALTGGVGSAVGSAIGALIYGMTLQGIVYAGWNPDWFKAFLGVMLLLATIVNLVVKNRAEAR